LRVSNILGQVQSLVDSIKYNELEKNEKNDTKLNKIKENH